MLHWILFRRHFHEFMQPKKKKKLQEQMDHTTTLSNSSNDTAQDQTSLAKSLMQLLWNEVQSHQPKVKCLVAAIIIVLSLHFKMLCSTTSYDSRHLLFGSNHHMTKLMDWIFRTFPRFAFFGPIFPRITKTASTACGQLLYVPAWGPLVGPRSVRYLSLLLLIAIALLTGPTPRRQ